MGRDRGNDPLVSCEFGDEFLHARKTLVDRLVIGWVEIRERLADDAAQTGLDRGRDRPAFRSNTCRRLVVTPASMDSSAPSSVPTRTISGVTNLRSIGST